RTSSLSLLADVRTLAEIDRRELSARSPEVMEWLKLRDEPPAVELREAPVVLFGRTSEQEVVDAWRQQLRASARALRGLLQNDPEMVRDWLYWEDRQGPRKEAQPFFRFEQIRDCVREVRKLTDLLTLAPRVIRLQRGRMLFESAAASNEEWKE